MLNIIVFSKDRACQLELFIRSMKFYFKEFKDYKINILYTFSDNKYKEGYDKLMSIYNDENLVYIKESQSATFKSHVLELLDPNNPYTVFFVDDIVFKNPFSLDSLQFKLLTLKGDILALSLRLHPKLTYCYPAQVEMTPPEFDNSFAFRWYGMKGDYGYPMSLDGHIFRTSEILAITRLLTFKNPNSYESMLAGYPLNRPKLICYEDSKIVNNPINKVQNFNNNIHGKIGADFLNEKFLEGYIINLETFKGIQNISCHQEIKVDLIKEEEKNKE